MTVAHVEFGTVPRTGYFKSAQGPFAECTAIMRADIIDAIILAIDVNQQYQSVVDFHGLLPGVGNVRHLRDSHKIAHGQAYSRTRRAIARPSASRTLAIVMRS